ncbi:MAG TPA: dihydroorotate dehydrogenase-like protein, partial [Lacipirellulaceae bacterium]
MRADLSTNYLGLRLKNPIVASAGPLTGELDTLRQLEQAGVAAAVLPSLFEEQITGDERRVHLLYEHHAHSFAESLSY